MLGAFRKAKTVRSMQRLSVLGRFDVVERMETVGCVLCGLFSV